MSPACEDQRLLSGKDRGLAWSLWRREAAITAVPVPGPSLVPLEGLGSCRGLHSPCGQLIIRRGRR